MLLLLMLCLWDGFVWGTPAGLLSEKGHLTRGPTDLSHSLQQEIGPEQPPGSNSGWQKTGFWTKGTTGIQYTRLAEPNHVYSHYQQGKSEVNTTGYRIMGTLPIPQGSVVTLRNAGGPTLTCSQSSSISAEPCISQTMGCLSSGCSTGLRFREYPLGQREMERQTKRA